MAFKIGDLLGWVLCPWRWGESEWGACSQAASLASGVCGPAVSHADRVPLVFFLFFLLRFPPHSSPFPFSSRVLSFCQRCNSISPLGFCFKKLKNKRGKKKKKKRILLRCDPLSVTQRQRALLHHGLVSEHYSVHIGEPYLRCLSPSVCLRGRTLFFYFSLRRTEPNIEADGDTPSL